MFCYLMYELLLSFRRAVHVLQGDGWALAALCGSWRQWERECGTSQEEDEATSLCETLLTDFQEKQQRLEKVYCRAYYSTLNPNPPILWAEASRGATEIASSQEKQKECHRRCS